MKINYHKMFRKENKRTKYVDFMIVLISPFTFYHIRRIIRFSNIVHVWFQEFFVAVNRENEKNYD